MVYFLIYVILLLLLVLKMPADITKVKGKAVSVTGRGGP
jgi:hypothetical protein